MIKLGRETIRKVYADDHINGVIFLRDNDITEKAVSRLHIKRYFPFINAVGGVVNRENIPYIIASNEIVGVTRETQVFTCGAATYNDIRIASYLSDKYTGKGVTICIIDTGVKCHLDLCVPCNRIISFTDIVNGKTHPYDDNGHGTFVAGAAAGNGLASARKICGAAPCADLVVIKAIDSQGRSSAFKILEAMQWVIDNRVKYNIKTVCMSFGSEKAEGIDPLEKGVEIMVKSGITAICASGNSGINKLKSPATSEYAISVGALDDKLKIAQFTSRGQVDGIVKPDVYALGVDVAGLSPENYTVMSGTSIAAPYVAGLSALIYEKYPKLRPEELKQMLLKLSMEYRNIKVL